MSPASVSLPAINNKQSRTLRNNRYHKSLTNESGISNQLIKQLLKFRVDGRTIDARNVDELYPGLDRLLMRSLQTGDCRQLFNRLNRNLKAEYLLITGKHIHLSVCSKTEDILEKLIEMGATLDLHFYEPIHMKELELLCKYGFDINECLPKYNNQAPLSIFINKRYSISMLNVLINHGAQFDLKDKLGQTCLHHACQTSVNDSVFDFIVEHAPNSCLNIQNQFGGTPLDMIYLTTYEHPNPTQMRRLHVLLSRKESKLTRYGMREPNLFTRKQYKLFDILSCKEFLFKYRLKDIFDPSVNSLSWCIFLFYDVLRACKKSTTNNQGQLSVERRLELYFISMIENGEIPLDKLIFQSHTSNLSSSSSSISSSISPISEQDQQILNDTQKSLSQMTQVKIKLTQLRTETLKLKALCRIKIKKEIRTFPNDIVKLNTISRLLQAYLTFYNPFVKGDVVDKIYRN